MFHITANSFLILAMRLMISVCTSCRIQLFSEVLKKQSFFSATPFSLLFSSDSIHRVGTYLQTSARRRLVWHGDTWRVGEHTAHYRFSPSCHSEWCPFSAWKERHYVQTGPAKACWSLGGYTLLWNPHREGKRTNSAPSRKNRTEGLVEGSDLLEYLLDAQFGKEGGGEDMRGRLNEHVW